MPYRLDMCRRQYVNDACNRGTAGKNCWTKIKKMFSIKKNFWNFWKRESDFTENKFEIAISEGSLITSSKVKTNCDFIQKIILHWEGNNLVVQFSRPCFLIYHCLNFLLCALIVSSSFLALISLGFSIHSHSQKTKNQKNQLLLCYCPGSTRCCFLLILIDLESELRTDRVHNRSSLDIPDSRFLSST